MRLFFVPICTALLMLTSINIHAENIKISSWNVEWLTVNPSHKISEAKRDSEDFSKLKAYFNRINADVIAFQEIDSIKALEKIASSNYTIVLSDRRLPNNSAHQFSDINQFTGFAIRNTVPFSDPMDIDLYGQANHKLRFASYVILYPESSAPVHLLSLHLKAGCTGKFYSNKTSCQTLLSQGKKLNQWIAKREASGEQYVITGDFNHNLSYRGDWLWETIIQGLKNQPQLASRNAKAECKVRKRNDPKQLHQFRSVIDHMIVSTGLTASDVKQTVYSTQDVLDYHLSDHCPINAQLNW